MTTQPPREVKIFGERNVGTNYLLKLIEDNLVVSLIPGTVPKEIGRLQRRLPGNEWLRDWYFSRQFSSTLGWKHSLVVPQRLIEAGAKDRALGFVALTKNPYSWLLSMHRRPYHQVRFKKPSFDQFIHRRWPTVRREYMEPVENPVMLWNRKNASYLTLSEALPTVIVRYEDLLADPDAITGRIAQTLGLEFRRDGFRNVDEAAKKRDSGKGFAYYQDYYLRERWRDALPAASIEFISRNLDPGLMKRLGYELI